MSNEGILAWAVTATLLAALFGLLLLFCSDNVDIDDVLAPMMCEAHGQTVQSVEWNCIGAGTDCAKSDRMLQIVCTKQFKELEDGYLLTTQP